MRQFFYDNFMQLVYTKLLLSTDKQIAAIASKAIKEVNYHLKFSSEWVIRMGDGTEESHERVQNAANTLWEFTGELFVPTDYDNEMASQGIAPDVTSLKNEWENRVNEIFAEATLQVPQAIWFQSGGKTGVHSENLGLLLTDLQYLQRTYPGASW
jgi:ring-1,2-phenylacetyl-CoA epoxidase subunit PaaC